MHLTKWASVHKISCRNKSAHLGATRLLVVFTSARDALVPINGLFKVLCALIGSVKVTDHVAYISVQRCKLKIVSVRMYASKGGGGYYTKRAANI